MTRKHLETTLVTAGRKPRFLHGSVNPVIQRASSLTFESVQQKNHATANRIRGALFYGRRGTLTHVSLQDAMCELEGGAGCYLYPCGAAAISNSILAFVETNDHILMTGAAYEPTQEFCNVVLKSFGIETTYYNPTIGAQIGSLIRPNTKVVFLESPSSITMEVQDIPAIVNAVRSVSKNISIMIDNTWAAGVLFPALEHGIDVSIQAGTKYIVGHSDAMLGTAVCNERCWNRLRERSYLMGQMVDADTAYIALRGLRTMSIRLTQHAQASIQIAKWLEQRSEVEIVNHPALPSCTGHKIYVRDFKGCNGLFSFVLKKRLSQEELENYLNHFEHFSMAYSWGGYDSLILASQPEELSAIRPINSVDFKGTLIRIHVGLENVSDLIEDLERGFDRVFRS